MTRCVFAFSAVLATLLTVAACDSDASGPTQLADVVDAGCAVGAEDCACTSGGACDPGLSCDMDVCRAPVCPVGSDGCECTGGGGCDAGLDCVGDMCELPGCSEGAEGCACTADGGCNSASLICEEGTCKTDLCPAGTPGCPCGAGDGCNTGMTCQSGLCDVPPCAAGADGCACRLNDACDGGLYCDNSICRVPPPSTCGDGVREGLEACDDGNQVTEACDYGVGECSVCDRDCKRVWGVAKFCGDGVRQADHGEACDTAGAGCAYGQQTCEVCVDCSWTTGNGPYCGDGTVQTQETCDGDVWCDDGCDGPWGQDFEDNDDTDDATKIETDAPGASFSNPKNGSFTHPTDVVEGPYAFVDGVFYDDDPDYFKVKVCAGATLTARIEFDNSQGNLNLYAGKRGTATGPNVIPGVSFNTVSDGLNADYEEVTVTNNDGTWRFYYILVQVYDDAPAPIINAYDLTGSLSGCPE